DCSTRPAPLAILRRHERARRLAERAVVVVRGGDLLRVQPRRLVPEHEALHPRPCAKRMYCAVAERHTAALKVSTLLTHAASARQSGVMDLEKVDADLRQATTRLPATDPSKTSMRRASAIALKVMPVKRADGVRVRTVRDRIVKV